RHCALTRPLPPEGDGSTPVSASAARPDPIVHRRRSRRGLLRDGGFVRLRAGALRRVATDWRAAGCAPRRGGENGRGAGRGRHVVPASGGTFHGRQSRSPCRATEIAAAKVTRYGLSRRHEALRRPRNLSCTNYSSYASLPSYLREKTWRDRYLAAR